MENKHNYLKNLIKNVLSENMELTEQPFLRALFAGGKDVSKEIRASLSDVIAFSKSEGQEIKMMALDSKGAPKTGTAIPVQTADDLINAIKSGALNSKEAARLYSGMLKSGAKFPQNVMDMIVKDLIESTRFTNQYAKLTEKEMRGLLQQKGYSQQSINTIVTQTKTNQVFKNARAKYKAKTSVKPETKKGKTETGKGKTGAETGKGGAVAQNKNINNITIINGGNAPGAIRDAKGTVIETPIASVQQGTKNLDDLANEAKAANDAKAADVLQDASQEVKEMKPSTWQKLKDKVKNMSKTQKILWGLAAAAGGFFALQFLFGGNTESEDEQYNVLPKCVTDLADDEGASFDTTEDGVVTLKLTKTGNAEYDKAGGIIFHNNGTVKLADGSKTGTYKCKESVGETGVQIQEIKVRFDEILKYNYGKNTLNEQSNEVSQDNMDSYVDTAVDDLDGYVAVYNLESLKNILLALKGKTYKGKDATQAFLYYYKQDEDVDFASDVQSVGIKTLGVKGMDLKQEILSMVAKAKPVETGGDGNKSTGLSGIEITWDDAPAPVKTDDGGGDKPPVKTDDNKPQDKVRECKDFPMEIGCISPRVVELQDCFKKKKLWDRTDGLFSQKFSDVLAKFFVDNGIKAVYNGKLTKELHTMLMTSYCKVGETQVLNPDPNQTAPVTSIPSKPEPTLPAEPVYDLKRLKELLASKNLVTKRDGTIVKWRGPELSGNDYYILNRYLSEEGYSLKKGREIGDKEDDDVQMKYKWKLNKEK